MERWRRWDKKSLGQGDGATPPAPVIMMAFEKEAQKAPLPPGEAVLERQVSRAMITVRWGCRVPRARIVAGRTARRINGTMIQRMDVEKDDHHFAPFSY